MFSQVGTTSFHLTEICTTAKILIIFAIQVKAIIIYASPIVTLLGSIGLGGAIFS